MTKFILEISQTAVIEKLKHLAQKHQLTLEEQIILILENAVEPLLPARDIESTGESENGFWELTRKFREQMEREQIVFNDADFADLRDRSVGREVEF